ncbi:hypothetical protein AGLY_014662 [Aphis glycines]|uniref:Uncharacterized protein n=1 Tax=Aphis glycines TaxID=307491 RepID=A0A6G0T282_APHGL|nr:hypothetical protein AGLY_014662 [Aphis glycines]
MTIHVSLTDSYLYIQGIQITIEELLFDLKVLHYKLYFRSTIYVKDANNTSPELIWCVTKKNIYPSFLLKIQLIVNVYHQQSYHYALFEKLDKKEPGLVSSLMFPGLFNDTAYKCFSKGDSLTAIKYTIWYFKSTQSPLPHTSQFPLTSSCCLINIIKYKCRNPVSSVAQIIVTSLLHNHQFKPLLSSIQNLKPYSKTQSSLGVHPTLTKYSIQGNIWANGY